MKTLMISALSSGSGKTIVTCAIIKALLNLKIKIRSFKCGPDFIDPMFHSRVLKSPCKNLDFFLQGEIALKDSLESVACDLSVIEGVMGYYDGIGTTTEGSSWHIAAITHAPVLLVINPRGNGMTLAAEIKGVMEFRKPNLIVGVFLNKCSESLFNYLKPIIEQECQIPVLGYLPKITEAEIKSRYLGLITADEIEDFDRRINVVAQLLQSTCNLQKLYDMAKEIKTESNLVVSPLPVERKCKIAVAKDEAFCFYYEENLKALEKSGAELIFFSPLHDSYMPEADGLYIGGGYPELYAEGLSKNSTLIQSIKNNLLNGMPYIAECGGFLYLHDKIDNYPMVGVFSGNGYATDKLQRFGYLELTSKKNSMLFKNNEIIPAHEFHYWDTSNNGSDLKASKTNGKAWQCSFCSKSSYAGFPHLFFNGKLPLAERFVQQAINYKEHK